MDTLEKDFKRFQTLHSWYKHIPLEGLDFYAYYDVGEQPRNGISPQVEDMSGAHWHFSDEKPKGHISLQVRFGPFLRGIEGRDGDEYVSGPWVIRELAGDAKFEEWLAKTHPDCKHTKWSYRDISHPDVLRVFRIEVNKYYGDLWMAMGPD